MENSILWHYKSPNNQELIKAINELEWEIFLLMS
jgi:hypothetical protein